MYGTSSFTAISDSSRLHSGPGGTQPGVPVGLPAISGVVVSVGTAVVVSVGAKVAVSVGVGSSAAGVATSPTAVAIGSVVGISDQGSAVSVAGGGAVAPGSSAIGDAGMGSAAVGTGVRPPRGTPVATRVLISITRKVSVGGAWVAGKVVGTL